MKFLKNGSWLDLALSLEFDNVIPMLEAGEADELRDRIAGLARAEEAEPEPEEPAEPLEREAEPDDG